MEEEETHGSLKDRTSTDILIKEYETLLILRQDYIRLGDNRFNFYLAIISGAAFFITWINSKDQSPLNPDLISFITGSTILGVLLFGLTTLFRIIGRNSRINELARAMARIRWYFTINYPEIDQYIMQSKYDNEPSFQGIDWYKEQLPIMLSIINGIVAGVGICMILFLFGWRWEIIIALGFIISAALSLAQIFLYDKVMKGKQEEMDKKNIPINPSPQIEENPEVKIKQSEKGGEQASKE